MSKLNENLASQLRAIRLFRKMTQTEVAVLALGNANRREQISKFEIGRTSITMDTAEKLFNAVNCDLVVVPREKSKAVYELLNK